MLVGIDGSLSGRARLTFWEEVAEEEEGEDLEQFDFPYIFNLYMDAVLAWSHLVFRGHHQHIVPPNPTSTHPPIICPNYELHCQQLSW